MQAAAFLKVVKVVGTVVAVVSSISQGNAARQQADFQAAVNLQQATREREIAGIAEEDHRREQRRILAHRRADLGGAGVDPATGTPLLAAEDFVTEAELQALRIRSGGAASATRLRQQANLTSAAGKSAQRAGFFRAGSSLLVGLGDIFEPEPIPEPEPKPKKKPS